jgi:hypothetical protein
MACFGAQSQRKKDDFFMIVYLYFCLLVNPNSAMKVAKKCTAPATPSEHQVFV